MGTPSQQTEPDNQTPAVQAPVFSGGCCAALLGLVSGACFGGLTGWRLTEFVPLDTVSALGGVCGGVIAGITGAAFAGRKQTKEKPQFVFAPAIAMILAALCGGVAGVIAALLGNGLEWRPGKVIDEDVLPLIGAGVGALCGAVGGLIGGAFGAAAAGGEHL